MAVTGTNELTALTGEINIYMARVGESEAMAKGILAGNQLNDNPLSEKGLLDARKAGENLVKVLKERQVKHVQVFTSNDVLRMKQTTDLVVEKLKEAGISYRRQSDSRLGGKNHGIFNASTTEDRSKKSELVKEKEKRNQMTAEEKFKAVIEGGESKQDIANKTCQLFQEIYQEPKCSADIVFVTSNNTLEALTALLNQVKPYEKINVGYPDILHLKQSGDKLKFVQIYKI